MEKRLQLIPLHTDSAEYPYCEDLYVKAFPPTERRTEEQLRFNTDHKKDFRFYALKCGEKAVGLLTCWDFHEFLYIEHFAVDEAMRGQHIGGNILKLFHETHPEPVILEVERPDTEIASRRIGFYERSGYTLWKSDYLQPPYQHGYDFLPLYLMCNSDRLQESKDYETIKEILYKKVYGICNN